MRKLLHGYFFAHYSKSLRNNKIFHFFILSHPYFLFLKHISNLLSTFFYHPLICQGSSIYRRGRGGSKTPIGGENKGEEKAQGKQTIIAEPVSINYQRHKNPSIFPQTCFTTYNLQSRLYKKLLASCDIDRNVFLNQKINRKQRR